MYKRIYVIHNIYLVLHVDKYIQSILRHHLHEGYGVIIHSLRLDYLSSGFNALKDRPSIIHNAWTSSSYDSKLPINRGILEIILSKHYEA